MPLQCTCRICGAAFTRFASTAGPYCSRACDARSKRRRVDVLCLTCGAPFTVTASAHAAGGGKYCSRGCYEQRNGAYFSLTCQHCQGGFERAPGIGRRGIAKYCSRACKDAAKTARTSTDAWFWARVNKTEGCWLWQGATQADGYGCVVRAYRRPLAHRISYAMAFGPIPDGLYVRHGCDNRRCVRPEHLSLGTVQENNRDAVERGRLARGERHRRARLTDDIVRAIRDRYAAGDVTQAALAREYGVHRHHLNAIVHRRLWKHVT